MSGMALGGAAGTAAELTALAEAVNEGSSSGGGAGADSGGDGGAGERRKSGYIEVTGQQGVNGGGAGTVMLRTGQ